MSSSSTRAGNLGLDGSGQQAVLLETRQSLGERGLWAETFQAPAELPEALRPVFEGADGQGAPLASILGAHDLLAEVRAVSVNPVEVKLRATAPIRADLCG
nr:hypothetical protein [uncultured Aeromicrobium sp.]